MIVAELGVLRLPICNRLGGCPAALWRCCPFRRRPRGRSSSESPRGGRITRRQARVKQSGILQDRPAACPAGPRTGDDILDGGEED
jgi:hypothetical protein